MYKLPGKLLTLRKHHRYSQKNLAKKLQMDLGEYMAYENGGLIPDFLAIQKIASFYRIRSLDLFREDEKPHLHHRRKLFTYINAEKIIAFWQKRKAALLGLVTILLFLPILWKTMQHQEKEYVVPSIARAETFAASDTTVVMVREGMLFGSGDNSNGQLTLAENDLIKVTEGATFTVALRKNGQLISAGLLNKFAKELQSYHHIIALEAGNGHILLLDADGKVFCVGDNTYGQCDLSVREGIQKIFAFPKASVLMNQEGKMFVSGRLFGISRIERLENIRDLAVSDNFIIYALENGEVEFETRGKDFPEVHTWSNVVQVVATNDFVAALQENGEVLMAIDNYVIQDEVRSWKEIQAIAAGKDYLVATDGNDIFGVGKNTYRQFEEKMILRNSLPQVKNVQVRIEDKQVKISFDPVRNATAYLVAIDIGTGYGIKTSLPNVHVSASDFESGKTYLLHITTLGEGDYGDSEVLTLDFVYRADTPISTPAPESSQNTQALEVPFSLEKLTGKTRVNLEAYLAGLGISEENMLGEVSQNLCTGSEELIETISGISDYEMVLKSELLTRKIHYTYCQLENK